MNNYMDSIYSIINSEEVVYHDNDDIIYLDEPEDEMFMGYDDELAWADDITYLDEPEDEEMDLDLGEGFIPLPQGEVYQEELIVIDEHYILDEFEDDLIENYEAPAIESVQEVQYSFDDIYSFLVDYDEEPIDVEKAESLIQLPVQQDISEELNVPSMSEEDDKIAKAIAKEHLENIKLSESGVKLYDEALTPEDDTSWVDGEDLFGNDISVIIAEDPNEEVVEEDYVEGSFETWLEQQNQ